MMKQPSRESNKITRSMSTGNRYVNNLCSRLHQDGAKKNKRIANIENHKVKKEKDLIKQLQANAPKLNYVSKDLLEKKYQGKEVKLYQRLDRVRSRKRILMEKLKEDKLERQQKRENDEGVSGEFKPKLNEYSE